MISARRSRKLRYGVAAGTAVVMLGVGVLVAGGPAGAAGTGATSDSVTVQSAANAMTAAKAPVVTVRGGLCNSSQSGMGNTVVGQPFQIYWGPAESWSGNGGTGSWPTAKAASDQAAFVTALPTRVDHYEVTLAVDSTSTSPVVGDFEDNQSDGAKTNLSVGGASTNVPIWTSGGTNATTFIPPDAGQNAANASYRPAGTASAAPPAAGGSTTYWLNNTIQGIAWGMWPHNTNWSGTWSGTMSVVAVGPGGWKSAPFAVKWSISYSYNGITLSPSAASCSVTAS